jgi:hypothetical protein
LWRWLSPTSQMYTTRSALPADTLLPSGDQSQRSSPCSKLCWWPYSTFSHLQQVRTNHIASETVTGPTCLYAQSCAGGCTAPCHTCSRCVSSIAGEEARLVSSQMGANATISSLQPITATAAAAAAVPSCTKQNSTKQQQRVAYSRLAC